LPFGDDRQIADQGEPHSWRWRVVRCGYRRRRDRLR
jgi:hypothetical protein